MNMAKIWCVSAVGAVLVALVGCVTNEPVAAPPAKPSVNVDTTVAHHKETVLSAREKIRSLCVFVQISANESVWKESAVAVERIVADELAQRGLTVVGNLDSAELVVSGKVTGTDQTRRGTRLVLRGLADLSMKRRLKGAVATKKAPVGGLISSQSLEAKSGESYSEVEALRSLGNAFGPEARRWVQTTCDKLAADIASCDITFSGLKAPQTAKDGFPTQLAAKLTALEGIYECRILSDERHPTTMTATVVYEKRLFPDGVLSRLRALGIVKTTEGAK